jgi:C4-type Zn-finger protein
VFALWAEVVVTFLDCPECGGPLDQVRAQDGVDDVGEVMGVYCPTAGCGWESVDVELGEAEVSP